MLAVILFHIFYQKLLHFHPVVLQMVATVLTPRRSWAEAWRSWVPCQTSGSLSPCTAWWWCVAGPGCCSPTPASHTLHSAESPSAQTLQLGEDVSHQIDHVSQLPCAVHPLQQATLFIQRCHRLHKHYSLVRMCLSPCMLFTHSSKNLHKHYSLVTMHFSPWVLFTHSSKPHSSFSGVTICTNITTWWRCVSALACCSPTQAKTCINSLVTMCHSPWVLFTHPSKNLYKQPGDNVSPPLHVVHPLKQKPV